MYPTSYNPLQAIAAPDGKNIGGFCKWWYVPIEWIEIFPAIDPLTQTLLSEPVLVADATWFGPVLVPDRMVGWKETQERARAGIYFKEKVEGFIPGNDPAQHINLQNSIYHQFCIIGMLRNGDGYRIIGSDQSGLDLDHETSSGIGQPDTPGSKLVFTGEQVYKALVLSGFSLAILPGTTQIFAQQFESQFQ